MRYLRHVAPEARVPRDGEGCGASDAGFTLVEVLVALMLLAAVLAMLPGGLGMIRTTQRAEAEMAGASEVAAVRETVARLVVGAMPVLVRRDDGTSGVALIGTADSMSFVGIARGGPSGPGVYRYTLVSRPQVAGHALVLRQTEAGDTGEDDPVSVSERVLLIATVPIGFRYFGAAAPQGEKSWSSGWTRGDAMPELVEVMLPAGEGGVARPLLVRPMLDVVR